MGGGWSFTAAITPSCDASLNRRRLSDKSETGIIRMGYGVSTTIIASDDEWMMCETHRDLWQRHCCLVWLVADRINRSHFHPLLLSYDVCDVRFCRGSGFLFSAHRNDLVFCERDKAAKLHKTNNKGSLTVKMTKFVRKSILFDSRVMANTYSWVVSTSTRAMSVGTIFAVFLIFNVRDEIQLQLGGTNRPSTHERS